jgi:hypothetical protein
LQKFKSFEEYIINQTRDIIYGTMMETFSCMNTKDDKDAINTGAVWNPFNTTTSPMAEDGSGIRIDTETEIYGAH